MKVIDGKTYLTERKEIVEFMNSHPCIRLDFTKAKDGWDFGSVHEGDLVACKYTSRTHGEMKAYGTLTYYGDSKQIVVSSSGCFISSRFGAEDINEIVERKNAVEVEAGQLVAIIEQFPRPNGCNVRVMKASKVDPFCCSVIVFNDVENID